MGVNEKLFSSNKRGVVEGYFGIYNSTVVMAFCLHHVLLEILSVVVAARKQNVEILSGQGNHNHNHHCLFHVGVTVESPVQCVVNQLQMSLNASSPCTSKRGTKDGFYA